MKTDPYTYSSDWPLNIKFGPVPVTVPVPPILAA